jgi:hypothetical protein
MSASRASTRAATRLGAERLHGVSQEYIRKLYPEHSKKEPLHEQETNPYR